MRLWDWKKQAAFAVQPDNKNSLAFGEASRILYPNRDFHATSGPWACPKALHGLSEAIIEAGIISIDAA